MLFFLSTLWCSLIKVNDIYYTILEYIIPTVVDVYYDYYLILIFWYFLTRKLCSVYNRQSIISKVSKPSELLAITSEK